MSGSGCGITNITLEWTFRSPKVLNFIGFLGTLTPQGVSGDREDREPILMLVKFSRAHCDQNNKDLPNVIHYIV